MTKRVLNDVRILAGADDLTGHSNQVEVGAEVAALDVTTFGGNGWRARIGGAATAMFNASGFLDKGAAALDPDAGVFAALDAGTPVAVTVAAGDAGSTSYVLSNLFTSYSPTAQHGEAASWAIEGASDGGLGRGLVLADDSTAHSTSDDLTAYQVGAIPDGGRMWVTLHVLAVTGTPTCTVTITSDAATPVDLLTFDPVTEPGWQLGEIAGPVATDSYRVSLDVSGTGSVTLFVAAGIVPTRG